MALSALVVAHGLAGTLALGAGTSALLARKGGPLHRGAGAVFLAAMAAMALTGSVMALQHGDRATACVGLLTLTLIATGWLAARAGDRTLGLEILAGAGCGFAVAAGFIGVALFDPDPVYVDALPYTFATLALLSAGLDVKAFVQRQTFRRLQRVRRHLWRLCTALFIASASFFLGQQDIFPENLRGWAIWYVLALLPLAALAFWMVKTRGPKAKTA